MQPNVITLAVDEDNSGSGTQDHVFTRFEEYQNRAVYIHSSHTVASRNSLSLYRTFPKQSGNFRGVSKLSVKFSVDATVPGADGVTTLKVPMIGEVSVALPVGVTDAGILVLRQKLVALLDRDDIMGPLMSQLMV